MHSSDANKTHSVLFEKLQAEGAVPERIFFEIVNHQAEVAVCLGERDLFQTYIERGIEGAHRLGSIQRHQELRETYALASTLWPHEQRIKYIEDLLHEGR
jgi:hypothetical protein